MTRSRYETEADRRREREVISKVAPWWGCVPRKVPERYRADFALMEPQGLFCFAEVKCRKSLLDPYWIALDKWIFMEQLGQYARRGSSMIIVQWPTLLAYVTVRRGFPIIWGGRTDRGDPDDLEPLVAIPIEAFTVLEKKP